uniref:JmjC domain-containing protein n=1 Tax=Macrostomum lignano TaxID=282301 RepID=A0A1I8F625_9PLAT
LSSRQSRAGHPPPPAAAFSFPRLRGGFEQRRQRQLLSRVLSAEAPAFGFESLRGVVQPCPRQSVLITWPAFGHRVDDLVASVPAGKVDGSNPSGLNWDDAGDCRKSRLMADVDRLGLRQCRTLSRLRLAGSESWCSRRLGDAAGSPGPRRAVRLRPPALGGPAAMRAERFADLAAGLSHLGYRELANPSPWPMHVSVGPGCYGNRNAQRVRRSSVGILQRKSRQSAAATAGRVQEPRCAAAELCGWWRSADRCDAATGSRPTDGVRVGGWHPAGSWEPSNESALASYLAEFPPRCRLAYLTYEPAHLVAYLSGLVQLTHGDWLCGRRLLAAAAGRVLSSGCAFELAPLSNSMDQAAPAPDILQQMRAADSYPKNHHPNEAANVAKFRHKFDYRSLRKGSTMVMFCLSQHQFLDGQIGLRMEQLETVRCCTCRCRLCGALAALVMACSVHKCWVCQSARQQRQSLYRCTGCGYARYCSLRLVSSATWPVTKPECAPVAACYARLPVWCTSAYDSGKKKKKKKSVRQRFDDVYYVSHPTQKPGDARLRTIPALKGYRVALMYPKKPGAAAHRLHGATRAALTGRSSPFRLEITCRLPTTRTGAAAGWDPLVKHARRAAGWSGHRAPHRHCDGPRSSAFAWRGSLFGLAGVLPIHRAPSWRPSGSAGGAPLPASRRPAAAAALLGPLRLAGG